MSLTETVETQTQSTVEADEIFSPDLTPEAVEEFVSGLEMPRKFVDIFVTLARTISTIGLANSCRRALYELRSGLREETIKSPDGDEVVNHVPTYPDEVSEAVAILESIRDKAGTADDLNPANRDGLAGRLQRLADGWEDMDAEADAGFAAQVMVDAAITAAAVKPSVTSLGKAGGGSRGQRAQQALAFLRSHPGQYFTTDQIAAAINGTPGGVYAALNNLNTRTSVVMEERQSATSNRMAQHYRAA